MNIIENEEWKVVPSLPPSIEVSNLGRVRKYVNSVQTEIVDGVINASGYRVVNMFGKTLSFHRIVAEAFVPNPEGFTVVKHLNGDKTDNRIENLEWVSHSNNFIEGRTSDSRNKIYCKELDQVYGSKRTASYATGVPQDIIANSIAEKLAVFGLTFEELAYNDERIKGYTVLYMDFNKMLEIAYNTSDVSEMHKAVMDALQD